MVKHHKRKALLLMEIKYRWITYYQRKINKMLAYGFSLNNPQLVSTYCKYENHIYEILEMKEKFQKETGEKVVFYQSFELAEKETGVMDVYLEQLKVFFSFNVSNHN